jgi:hypothetical protein
MRKMKMRNGMGMMASKKRGGKGLPSSLKKPGKFVGRGRKR